MSSTSGSLTSGTLLARNIGFNLLGWALPALAALIAVPILLRGLGDARFGVLALAWTTIGYFSLFDLGIGRALTHAAADRLGRDAQDEIGSAVWTAISVILPLGLLGTVALLWSAPWIVRSALQVPPELERETIIAFRVLAVAVPFTGIAAAFRGLLEATQRFGLVNALRVPYGLMTFVGPIAVLPFSRSLVPAIAVLTIGRIVLCLAYVVACRRVIPHLTGGRFQKMQLRDLVTYGGWMTVSNVISPLMTTFDRFLIGGAVGVTMVTYYVTPNELATKMWLFTAATMPVFFPSFATTAVRDPARTGLLLGRMLRIAVAGLALPTLLMVLLAREILGVWLGGSFTGDAAVVLQVLAVAVFVNCLGQGGYTFIQALGRPDITGKLHLLELPFYALLVWLLLPRYGIIGAALAWGLRVTVDAVLLLWFCPRLLREAREPIALTSRWLAVLTPLIALAAFVPATSTRLVVALIATPLWAAVVWRWLLTEQERRAPLQMLSAALPTASR